MWAAKIADKQYLNGALFVNVFYSNGTASFNEIIDLTGGSVDILSSKIQGRLDTLNASDAALTGITLGTFTPTTKPDSSLQTFLAALKVLRSAQTAVDLKLMASSDKAFTDALAAAQAAFSPTFIGQF